MEPLLQDSFVARHSEDATMTTEIDAPSAIEDDYAGSEYAVDYGEDFPVGKLGAFDVLPRAKATGWTQQSRMDVDVGSDEVGSAVDFWNDEGWRRYFSGGVENLTSGWMGWLWWQPAQYLVRHDVPSAPLLNRLNHIWIPLLSLASSFHSWLTAALWLKLGDHVEAAKEGGRSFTLLFVDICSAVPLVNPTGKYKTHVSEDREYAKVEEAWNLRRLRKAVGKSSVHVLFGNEVQMKLLPQFWTLEKEGLVKVSTCLEVFPMEDLFKRAQVAADGRKSWTARVTRCRLVSDPKVESIWISAYHPSAFVNWSTNANRHGTLFSEGMMNLLAYGASGGTWTLDKKNEFTTSRGKSLKTTWKTRKSAFAQGVESPSGLLKLPSWSKASASTSLPTAAAASSSAGPLKASSSVHSYPTAGSSKSQPSSATPSFESATPSTLDPEAGEIEEDYTDLWSIMTVPNVSEDQQIKALADRGILANRFQALKALYTNEDWEEFTKKTSKNKRTPSAPMDPSKAEGVEKRTKETAERAQRGGRRTRRGKG